MAILPPVRYLNFPRTPPANQAFDSYETYRYRRGMQEALQRGYQSLYDYTSTPGSHPICMFDSANEAVNTITSGVLQLSANTYTENIVLANKTNITIRGLGAGTLINGGNGIGIRVSNCANCVIENLAVEANICVQQEGGTRSKYQNLFLNSNGLNCIDVNGDLPTEDTFEHIYMWGGSNATFKYRRTNGNDSGGIRMVDVTAYGNGAGGVGFLLTGSVGVAIYVFMDTITADNYANNYAAWLRNVYNYQIDKGYFTVNSNTLPAVFIDGGGQGSVSGWVQNSATAGNAMKFANDAVGMIVDRCQLVPGGANAFGITVANMANATILAANKNILYNTSNLCDDMTRIV